MKQHCPSRQLLLFSKTQILTWFDIITDAQHFFKLLDGFTLTTIYTLMVQVVQVHNLILRLRFSWI